MGDSAVRRLESLDKVLTSELSRRRSDTAGIRRYIHRLYLVNGHLVAPAILFAMGLTPAFIVVVAGSEYAGAIVPAMILCLAELCPTVWTDICVYVDQCFA